MVLHHSGAWYLIAFCQMRQALRLFALHRVQEYKLLTTAARQLPREEIDSWIDSAFQLEHGENKFTVTVKFAPHAARYVRERIWHSQQALQDLPDGVILLTFPASSHDEVMRWLASYVADAVVLEPASLREAMINSLQLQLRNYQ